MRRCSKCGRTIKDTESCVRDFDGKYACSDCYPHPVTSMPKHGEK